MTLKCVDCSVTKRLPDGTTLKAVHDGDHFGIDLYEPDGEEIGFAFGHRDADKIVVERIEIYRGKKRKGHGLQILRYLKGHYGLKVIPDLVTRTDTAIAFWAAWFREQDPKLTQDQAETMANEHTWEYQSRFFRPGARMELVD